MTPSDASYSKIHLTQGQFTIVSPEDYHRQYILEQVFPQPELTKKPSKP